LSSEQAFRSGERELPTVHTIQHASVEEHVPCRALPGRTRDAGLANGEMTGVAHCDLHDAGGVQFTRRI